MNSSDTGLGIEHVLTSVYQEVMRRALLPRPRSFIAFKIRVCISFFICNPCICKPAQTYCCCSECVCSTLMADHFPNHIIKLFFLIILMIKSRMTCFFFFSTDVALKSSVIFHRNLPGIKLCREPISRHFWGRSAETWAFPSGSFYTVFSWQP